MTRGLADTSVFVARESGRPIETAALPDEITVSVITIGELRSGVLSAEDPATRDRRLLTLTAALALDPVPVDVAVAEVWARLRVELRAARRSVPVNDSWIAATAIAQGIPVLTQDRDYRDVPGLEVLEV